MSGSGAVSPAALLLRQAAEAERLLDALSPKLTDAERSALARRLFAGLEADPPPGPGALFLPPDAD